MNHFKPLSNKAFEKQGNVVHGALGINRQYQNSISSITTHFQENKNTP